MAGHVLVSRALVRLSSARITDESAVLVALLVLKGAGWGAFDSLAEVRGAGSGRGAPWRADGGHGGGDGGLWRGGE